MVGSRKIRLSLFRKYRAAIFPCIIKKGDHVSRPSCQNDSFQDVSLLQRFNFCRRKPGCFTDLCDWQPKMSMQYVI